MTNLSSFPSGMQFLAPQAFQDRHVVVTGGAGALGQQVVSMLCSLGATCHIPCIESDHNAPPVHSQAIYYPNMDLVNEDSVVHFYQSLPTIWASIHIAGGFLWSPLTETSLQATYDQWNMNAITCFLSTREAVKNIRNANKQVSQGGRIVNVSSNVIHRPATGMAAYAMAKASVAALTSILGVELKSEKIWVNAVAPSIIDTPANRQAMPNANFSNWPKPEEVAQVIVFLASTANAVITGEIIPVVGSS